MTTNKDPNLKLRYSQGLGDVIACFLHSKPVGWFTRLVTGEDKPCNECNVKRKAYNTILPFPLWKLFFKDEKDFMVNFSEDYKKNGYNVSVDDEHNTISTAKSDFTDENGNVEALDNFDLPEEFEQSNLDDYSVDGYVMTNVSDNYLGEYLIRTQYFKKK